MWKQLLKFSKIQRSSEAIIKIGMNCAPLLVKMEICMINQSTEKQSDPIVLEEDFNLAFKLVFFDENDREVEPVQYKALSTFSVERDLSRQ